MSLRSSFQQVVHSPRSARYGYAQPWYRRVGVWLGRFVILGSVLVAAVSLSAVWPSSAGPGSEWHAVDPAAKWPLPDAIVGGQEGGIPLYPCRGFINGDLHVGRARSDFGSCHVGFDGREAEVAPYEVLSTTWLGSGGAISAEAHTVGIEAVQDAQNRFTLVRLALCRAAFEGGVHSGQSKAGERGCSFGFGGKQIVASAYDVLLPSPWMEWVPGTPRDLPSGAIVSGSEGNEPFYACRASDRTGLHPGKIKRTSLGCSIASEGKEGTVSRFEVLVPRWRGGSAGTAPVAAYPAGREAKNIQFVCRVQSRDTVQVGKVNERLGGCHAGMQGAEVVFKEYDVLAQ